MVLACVSGTHLIYKFILTQECGFTTLTKAGDLGSYMRLSQQEKPAESRVREPGVCQLIGEQSAGQRPLPGPSKVSWTIRRRGEITFLATK